MTTITNISGPSSAVTAQAPVLSSAQISGGSNAALTAAAQNQPVTTPSRVIADPLSGTVITQILDNNGQIASQFPTRAVVAYLQEGLTSEGFPPPSNYATTA
jgi:hypothetical protein